MNNNNMTMQEMPVSERPYEKCEKYGPENLSDGELLAVIIRTGSKGERATELTARLLRSLPGENLAGLYHITLEKLLEIRGIGRVKALQLLCISELVKRMVRCQLPMESLVCDEPGKIAMHFMASMRYLETEQVRLLVLNGRNALIKDVEVSKGSFNAAMAAPREIFYYAIKYKATGIILLHNHPSGDPSPSREDMMITRRVKDTGEMIGIPLLDHIVLGDNRYVSFRESGFLS